MNSRTELDHLFATEVVVASCDLLPRQRRMLSRLLHERAIERLLPGIYVPVGSGDDLRVRCAAVMRWEPDAVISGLAAASLSFWPKARPTTIEVCNTTRRGGPAWLRLRRTKVPEEHVAVREGLRITRAAWTAVSRAADDNGEAIDNALRERVVKLPDLTAALRDHCGRHGNSRRRPVVRDSRSNPWSQGERGLHRDLRKAGLSGWVANHWVQLSRGSVAVDVAFVALKLAIEFDGWETHCDRDAFERDREKQNALFAEQGWVVLRVTWLMLSDPKRLIATIRRALRSQARRLNRRLSEADRRGW